MEMYRRLDRPPLPKCVRTEWKDPSIMSILKMRYTVGTIGHPRTWDSMEVENRGVWGWGGGGTRPVWLPRKCEVHEHSQASFLAKI